MPSYGCMNGGEYDEGLASVPPPNWVLYPNDPGHKVFAIRRLLADLREVQENPLPNICALPVNDNLFEWHGNMQDPSSDYKDAIFHFIMYFTPNYPVRPPGVAICSRVKNPKVSEAGRDCCICMDILEREFSPQDRLIWREVCSPDFESYDDLPI